MAPHLVYRVLTEPELIKAWWAGRRGTVTSAEVDLRVGGTWRYAMQADGGMEIAFRGEYREIVPDERVVFTEIYEAGPARQTTAMECCARTRCCPSGVGRHSRS